MESKKFRLIISELNLQARKHSIAKFREIRKKLKSLSKLPPKDIFTKRTTFDSYAFHDGGRKELQLNVGIERLNGNEELRYGIAFSFETSRSFPNIKDLFPKVKRFNEFLQLYPEKYADMRMWHYTKKEVRSSDYMPTSIPHELVTKQVFVFLGKRISFDEIDYELMLNEMYRLLPLYQYVEGVGNTLPATKAPFEFRPGFTTAKKTTSVVSQAQKELDINLRHNLVQEELCRKLSEKYGTENVQGENPSGIDIVVRQNDEYWFYEIKTSDSPRICIRQALGQLLEYAFWSGEQNATRLIVVGEAALDEEGTKYLITLKKLFSLPIEYEQIVIKSDSAG
jgi:hypothetical protein